MQSARASITMPITKAIRSVLHRNSSTPSANYTKKRYTNLYNEITLVLENITFPLPVQYKEIYLHCRTKMLSQTIVANTIFMIISITISLLSSLGNKSKNPDPLIIVFYILFFSLYDFDLFFPLSSSLPCVTVGSKSPDSTKLLYLQCFGLPFYDDECVWLFIIHDYTFFLASSSIILIESRFASSTAVATIRVIIKIFQPLHGFRRTCLLPS